MTIPRPTWTPSDAASTACLRAPSACVPANSSTDGSGRAIPWSGGVKASRNHCASPTLLSVDPRLRLRLRLPLSSAVHARLPRPPARLLIRCLHFVPVSGPRWRTLSIRRSSSAEVRGSRPYQFLSTPTPAGILTPPQPPRREPARHGPPPEDPGPSLPRGSVR